MILFSAVNQILKIQKRNVTNYESNVIKDWCIFLRSLKGRLKRDAVHSYLVCFNNSDNEYFKYPGDFSTTKKIIWRAKDSFGFEALDESTANF